MGQQQHVTERFDEHRTHLRAVAYRMLGSLSDADDAVQEAWLRFSRIDVGRIENLGGYLTRVVANVCLNMLRSRSSRREEPLGVHLPEPIVSRADGTDLEREALLADSVGLALFVLLDTLSPAERLALVLHDMFAMPYDEIAGIVGRSPAATRQLASRARRRVRATDPVPDPDLAGQRRVVDTFLAAARDGDLETLVAVLDPDVELRTDGGVARAHLSGEVRGASNVARLALTYSRPSAQVRPVLVNGAAGVVVAAGRRPLSVMGFTVKGGRIAAIQILADPDRLRRLDPALFEL